MNKTKEAIKEEALRRFREWHELKVLLDGTCDLPEGECVVCLEEQLKQLKVTRWFLGMRPF